MYCRNCGSEMDPNAVVCVKCGVEKNKGSNSYCPNCGEIVNPAAAVCVKCGTALQAAPSAGGGGGIGQSDKSRLVAGLLGIFLGALGIHNFYLGFTKKAIIQLLATLIGGAITCGVVSVGIEIWALVEAIMILASKDSVDADGRVLRD